MDIPVYVTNMYKIKIWTEYQEQMNQIIQPFIVEAGGINHFVLERDGHRFEGFVQDNFNLNNNISEMTEEARKYETEFEIKVLGYLIGSGENDKYPKISIRENAVEYIFPRERTVTEDEITHTNRIKEWREK